MFLLSNIPKYYRKPAYTNYRNEFTVFSRAVYKYNFLPPPYEIKPDGIERDDIQRYIVSFPLFYETDPPQATVGFPDDILFDLVALLSLATNRYFSLKPFSVHSYRILNSKLERYASTSIREIYQKDVQPVRDSKEIYDLYKRVINFDPPDFRRLFNAIRQFYRAMAFAIIDLSTPFVHLTFCGETMGKGFYGCDITWANYPKSGGVDKLVRYYRGEIPEEFIGKFQSLLVKNEPLKLKASFKRFYEENLDDYFFLDIPSYVTFPIIKEDAGKVFDSVYTNRSKFVHVSENVREHVIRSDVDVYRDIIRTDKSGRDVYDYTPSLDWFYRATHFALINFIKKYDKPVLAAWHPRSEEYNIIRMRVAPYFDKTSAIKSYSAWLGSDEPHRVFVGNYHLSKIYGFQCFGSDSYDLDRAAVHAGEVLKVTPGERLAIFVYTSWLISVGDRKALLEAHNLLIRPLVFNEANSPLSLDGYEYYLSGLVSFKLGDYSAAESSCETAESEFDDRSFLNQYIYRAMLHLFRAKLYYVRGYIQASTDSLIEAARLFPLNSELKNAALDVKRGARLGAILDLEIFL